MATSIPAAWEVWPRGVQGERVVRRDGSVKCIPRGNRGAYRILYMVDEDAIYVLHVRHGFQLPAEASSGERF